MKSSLKALETSRQHIRLSRMDNLPRGYISGTGRQVVSPGRRSRLQLSGERLNGRIAVLAMSEDKLDSAQDLFTFNC